MRLSPRNIERTTLAPTTGALAVSLLLVACRPGVGSTTPAALHPLDEAIVRTSEGIVDTEAFVERVAEADMICLGEQHDDARHHEVQAALFERLVRSEDRRVALGLEMVQRPEQTALDDFLRGDLDASRLAEVIDWEQRWGFDFSMYEPMFLVAHDHGARLIALNAPQELTRSVARLGLERLPDEVVASLPELKLDDPSHRRFFWAAMGFDDPGSPSSPHDPHHPPSHDPHHPPSHDPHDPHHPPSHDPHHSPHGHGASAERFYTAQVIWDETMAESAAAWLTEPERQVMVIAGNGHCHRSAIPARVARRRPEAETLSVLLQSGDVPLPPHAESDFVVQLPAGRNSGGDPPGMADASRRDPPVLQAIAALSEARAAVPSSPPPRRRAFAAASRR